MEIAYAAHTESCTFMLDADGICRWVAASNPSMAHRVKNWEKSQQAASRCVGAQYVASLDVTSRGGLVEMPRVGVPMLFARVDHDSGRVTLVRTGPVIRFEVRGQPRDDYDSGLRERPQAPAAEASWVMPQPAREPARAWAPPAPPPRAVLPRTPMPRTPMPRAPIQMPMPADTTPVPFASSPDTDREVSDESETRRMRRGDSWDEVEDNEWETDTETARVELHPDALDRMRPTGTSGFEPRAPMHMPARGGAYSLPIPRPAPLPRATPLPAAPTNRRPTVPPPGGYQIPRAPAAQLPLPPGYAPPRTPPPAPPTRRVAYETPPPRPTHDPYNAPYESQYPPTYHDPYQARHQEYRAHPAANHQSSNHQAPYHQSPYHQSPNHQSPNHQSPNHQSQWVDRRVPLRRAR